MGRISFHHEVHQVQVLSEHAKSFAPDFGSDPLGDDQYDDKYRKSGDCVQALKSRRAKRGEVHEIPVAQARRPRELRRDCELRDDDARDDQPRDALGQRVVDRQEAPRVAEQCCGWTMGSHICSH